MVQGVPLNGPDCLFRQRARSFIDRNRVLAGLFVLSLVNGITLYVKLSSEYRHRGPNLKLFERDIRDMRSLKEKSFGFHVDLPTRVTN